MIYGFVSMGLLLVVVILVVSWWGKGKNKRLQGGPSVPDLTSAEHIMRIEELHEQGKMSDEEYHAAKSKLLS